MARLLVSLGICAFVSWRLYLSLRTSVVGGGFSVPSIPRDLAPGLFWFFVAVQAVVVALSATSLVYAAMLLVPSLSGKVPLNERFGALTWDNATMLVSSRLSADPCIVAMNLGEISPGRMTGGSHGWETAEVMFEIKLGPASPARRSEVAACYGKGGFAWLPDVGPAIAQGRKVDATEPFEFRLTETGWRLVEGPPPPSPN